MNNTPIGLTFLAALTLLFTATFIGCTTPPTQTATPTCATIAAELQPLQGSWEGAMVGDATNRKITITITNGSLHFHRDAEFWFKTTFTIPAGKNPQELHATIKDCAPPAESIGKIVVALFKIENETLTLAATGDDAADTAKTFDSPGLARYELRNRPKFRQVLECVAACRRFGLAPVTPRTADILQPSSIMRLNAGSKSAIIT